MKHLGIVIGVTAGILAGCSNEGRLADLAEQVTHEQAAQNERMAESTQTIAQGSQQLVAADAQARGDLIDLQHALRQDQAEIAKQRDVLEVERGEIAQERLTDSQVGGGLIALGLLLAALAPLVLAGISLLGLWRDPTREEEGQILIEELSKGFLADGAPENSEPPSDPHYLEDSPPSRPLILPASTAAQGALKCLSGAILFTGKTALFENGEAQNPVSPRKPKWSLTPFAKPLI